MINHLHYLVIPYYYKCYCLFHYILIFEELPYLVLIYFTCLPQVCKHESHQTTSMSSVFKWYIFPVFHKLCSGVLLTMTSRFIYLQESRDLFNLNLLNFCYTLSNLPCDYQLTRYKI